MLHSDAFKSRGGANPHFWENGPKCFWNHDHFPRNRRNSTPKCAQNQGVIYLGKTEETLQTPWKMLQQFFIHAATCFPVLNDSAFASTCSRSFINAPPMLQNCSKCVKNASKMLQKCFNNVAPQFIYKTRIPRFPHIPRIPAHSAHAPLNS